MVSVTPESNRANTTNITAIPGCASGSIQTSQIAETATVNRIVNVISLLDTWICPKYHRRGTRCSFYGVALEKTGWVTTKRRKIVYGLAVLWLCLLMIRLVSDGEGLDERPAAVALSVVTVILIGFGAAAVITGVRGGAGGRSSRR